MRGVGIISAAYRVGRHVERVRVIGQQAAAIGKGDMRAVSQSAYGRCEAAIGPALAAAVQLTPTRSERDTLCGLSLTTEVTANVWEMSETRYHTRYIQFVPSTVLRLLDSAGAFNLITVSLHTTPLTECRVKQACDTLVTSICTGQHTDTSQSVWHSYWRTLGQWYC